MVSMNLPVLSNEAGFSRYLREISAFPMLTKEEEFALARGWKKHEDISSAQKLVTSHLRLVVKIARSFKGYGLPMADLVSEGNLGLMRAVKGFDPERGFRLATYAIWWIRAGVIEYVLRSWSLVKIGTMAAQKRLFFGLKKIKNKLQIFNKSDLSPSQSEEISETLGVSQRDVVDMDRRLSSSDLSLNAHVGKENSVEYQDLLQDPGTSLEDRALENSERKYGNRLLSNAMKVLNDREQHILRERKLKDNPKTLEELAKFYKISRERIRQIEARAFEKLQTAVIKEKESSSDI